MLDNGDKAQCREIAREIIVEVLKEYTLHRDEMLKSHQLSCPHGEVIRKTKFLLIGAFLGGGLSGGGAVGLIQILTGG